MILQNVDKPQKILAQKGENPHKIYADTIHKKCWYKKRTI